MKKKSTLGTALVRKTEKTTATELKTKLQRYINAGRQTNANLRD